MGGIKAFLGPTRESLAIRHPPGRLELRSFGGSEADYPYSEDADSWDDLLGRTPVEFSPDVVVW